ncbi:MAG: antibiotic biosynthesis monooxygenase [Thermoplasmata archaeon]
MPWLLVNRISVESPKDAEVLVEAFRHRAGKVDQQPGFLGIEVLREVEGKEVMISTRWQNRHDFEAWLSSPAFQTAHQHVGGGPASAQGTAYEVVL